MGGAQIKNYYQADKALKEFLEWKQTVDRALTDKEKEIEAQRAQTEAVQQEQARLKQMMERSHHEQLQLLKEKMEQEKKLMEEETKKMIQHKLKEQEELLKEWFQQRANEMESEIQKSQRRKSKSQGVCCII